MVEAIHLTKNYGDRIIIKDVSFSLEKGTIVGFLGPNGAGKSTTMNMITGFLAPSDGSVQINSLDMLKNPEKAKRHIGYLPEIPPLYLEMTVYEYLHFVASLKKISKDKIEAEALRVVEKTSLSDVKNRLIRNLSKGYKQRVGLAGALIGDPEVLILDEPTVGLDPKQIFEFRKLISSLKENHTIILSTHILSEAENLCDRFIIISHGHIMADDSPSELVKKFNRNDHIFLSLKSNSTTAQMLLDSISEIKEYHIISEAEGISQLEIFGEDNKDLCEIISTKCNENNILMLELYNKKCTLEDIYLKLTGEEYYTEMLLKGDTELTDN